MIRPSLLFVPAFIASTILLSLGTVESFHTPLSISHRPSSMINPEVSISGKSRLHSNNKRNSNSNWMPAAVVALKMSSDGDTSTEKSEAVVSADGTFYDDELDSAPKKDGISDSMRARLMKEASTGLDSEQKQTNVLLYIILGVAVLVVLGGSGILY